MRADGLRRRVKTAQDILSGVQSAFKAVDTLEMELEEARRTIEVQREMLREFQNSKDFPPEVERLSPVPRAIARLLWQYKGKRVRWEAIEHQARLASPSESTSRATVSVHLSKFVRPAFSEIGLTVYPIHALGCMLDD